MKYVVTGGAGFVGSYLVKLLIKEGHKVTVVDNLYKGKKENLRSVLPEINFEEIDIRDYENLKDILKDIDGVFHQAALTVVQDSFDRPEEYHDVNVAGTENIFKLAKKNNFKVVYASSSSVYGHKKNVPIMENSERNPINPYGKTKLDDEHLFEKYSKMGTKIIGLRYFNIFGKGQTVEYAGVITKFLDRINQKQSPIIFGNGTQLRDFIYVEDIVMANLKAMESKTQNLLVNVGTGDAITIAKLAEMMIDISGLDVQPIFESPLEGDIQMSQANIDLAVKSFGWKPEMKLEKWLKTIIK
ncbi:NAD-dependent epimerase/dehydratase family protein [Candidatus Nitrosopelagicus sp.]|nr:NAD-dependent epimerase/dehydratase family protein [Candidatus Nitrosopelagicus sp.]